MISALPGVPGSVYGIATFGMVNVRTAPPLVNVATTAVPAATNPAFSAWWSP